MLEDMMKLCHEDAVKSQLLRNYGRIVIWKNSVYYYLLLLCPWGQKVNEDIELTRWAKCWTILRYRMPIFVGDSNRLMSFSFMKVSVIGHKKFSFWVLWFAFYVLYFYYGLLLGSWLRRVLCSSPSSCSGVDFYWTTKLWAIDRLICDFFVRDWIGNPVQICSQVAGLRGVFHIADILVSQRMQKHL